MTDRNYVGGNHNFTSAAAWSPAGTPQPGDYLVADDGVITVAGLALQNIGITLESGSPTLVLQNSSLDAASSILSTGEDELNPPEIETKGKTTNAGAIADVHNNLGIAVSAGTFTNAGTIHAQQGIDPSIISITASGKLVNSGTLLATGNGATPGGTINLTGNLSNSGDIVADGGATINLTETGIMQNTGVIDSENSFRPAGYDFLPAVNLALTGTLNNSGTISNYANLSITGANTTATIKNTGSIINDGTMTLTANMTLNKAGTFVQGGMFIDEASISGNGTVQLTSGMIEFGSSGSPNFVGTPSAKGFGANLDFTSSIGTLQFDNAQVVFGVLSPKDVLNVYAVVDRGADQIASIQLTGGTYTQNEFSSHGNQILFSQS
jgi:hypothetical protein